jgi:hypothetical protein
MFQLSIYLMDCDKFKYCCSYQSDSSDILGCITLDDRITDELELIWKSGSEYLTKYKRKYFVTP